MVVHKVIWVVTAINLISGEWGVHGVFSSPDKVKEFMSDDPNIYYTVEEHIVDSPW